jgi:hypothetical protein
VTPTLKKITCWYLHTLPTLSCHFCICFPWHEILKENNSWL